MNTLIDAKKLISNPINWTKGANARTYPGGPTCPTCSIHARCWCAQGAVWRTGPNGDEINRALDILGLAARSLGMGGVVSTNDYGGHEMVMKMFDLAIAGTAKGGDA